MSTGSATPTTNRTGAGTTLELRVHGIGGPSAAGLLGRPSGEITIPVWRGDPTARSTVRRLRGDHQLLAYHWAPLTSGSRWFALWPTLLPFTLLNAAGWMHPRSTSRIGRWRVALVRALVQLLGLLLTSVVVVWTSVAALGVVSHQLGDRSATTRYAVAMGVTGLVLLVVLLASGVSVRGFDDTAPPWCSVTTRAGTGSPLTDPCFFRQVTGRWWAWWSVHAVVALATWVVVIVFGARSGVDDPFPWIGRAALSLTAVQVSTCVLLAIASLRRHLLWALAGPAAALFGSVMVGGIALALVIVLAGLSEVPSGPASVVFDVYGWSVLAAGVAAVVIAIGCLVVPVLIEREADRADRRDRAAGVRSPGNRVPYDRLVRTNRAAVQARFARLPALLPAAGGAFSLTFTVLFVWLGLDRFFGDDPVDSYRLADDLPVDVARITFWGIVVYMFLSVVRSRADAASLRRVGNVWDVLCFWPRSVHPFAVRPYSERAVPELQGFVAAGSVEHRVVITAHSQGSVLAYAALAPMLSGAGPDPDRVCLVTFGSPLRTLYANAFPAYVVPEDIDRLRAALGERWTNVFRYTDHVGRAVFVEEPHLVDLVSPGPDAADRPVPDPLPGERRVAAHSGYWDEPTIRRIVTTAFDSVTTGPPEEANP